MSEATQFLIHFPNKFAKSPKHSHFLFSSKFPEKEYYQLINPIFLSYYFPISSSCQKAQIGKPQVTYQGSVRRFEKCKRVWNKLAGVLLHPIGT